MDVEIWSDVVCPWCYIGKRRFEAALARFEHADELSVTWRSFELAPNAPAREEGDRAVRLAAKYNITVEQAHEAEHNVTAVAAGEGLEYRLDIAQSANSFDAHRLIHLAAEFGLQDAMKERLMHAYFTEGRLISDHETLAVLADELGIPAAATIDLLRTDNYTDAVRAEEELARQFGLSGVPTFVVDRAIAVSGAQPAETLVKLLDEGWERSNAADRSRRE
jgi:predicted DsbA family dithiol-disulfide isomerase